MLRLHECQNLMAAYLLAAPGADAPEALLASTGGARSAAARLGIYKNNVYVRLSEALEAAYPAVKRLVGEDFFRFAARAYIPKHPPRSGLLSDFCEGFAAFLESFAPATSVVYLADVARLEQLYLRAYHAPDISPLEARQFTPALFSARSTVRLHLHPSAGLMASPHPVSRIWELNRRDGNVEETDLPWQAERLLVIRPRTQVEVRRLSVGAYAMVSAIHAGQTLAEAMAEARRAQAGFEPRRALAQIVNGGTFTSFHRPQANRTELV